MLHKVAITILLCLSTSCAFAIASDVTQPDSARLSQMGIAAYKKGDYQSAVRFLSARTRLQPEDSNVYYYLGNSFLQLKQNDQAAHMFSSCVRVSPTSQAGKYSLTALESLSTMPKTSEVLPNTVENKGPDPEAVAASKEALMSEKAVDKAFNDSVMRIKGYRQNLKVRVDHIWLLMQDEMQAMTARNNPNYAVDLEKLQREAENKVQDVQTRELRLENRLMAPDKIDVRAIPGMPSEKADDTKTALGSLMDYFKAEKPFDPFGTDIKPELTSKFMTIRDVFGELATYQSSARKLSKQVFAQLKSGIEAKQDQLDGQLYNLKGNLIHDVVNIKMNFGSQSNSRQSQQVSASTYINSAKLPRSDQTQLSPMDVEIQQVVERNKKRIKELEDGYYHEVDVLIAGAKEKLGGMVAQTGQMNSQMQKPSGNIQLVPQGTDMYTRNYINFGDRELSVSGNKMPALKPVPLKAEAKKLPESKGKKNAGAH